MKKILLVWISVSLSTYFVQAQQLSMITMADAKPGKETKAEPGGLKSHIRKVLKKLTGSKVSVQSENSFREQFGNVSDVKWERQDYFDVAEFTKDGQFTKAYFGNDGELVGTLTPRKLDDLPANAKKEIARKYADYTVEDVILYDDNNEQIGDIILFGDQMESTDNYFVELKKDSKKVILEVSPEGKVSFFKELKS